MSVEFDFLRYDNKPDSGQRAGPQTAAMVLKMEAAGTSETSDCTVRRRRQSSTHVKVCLHSLHSPLLSSRNLDTGNI